MAVADSQMKPTIPSAPEPESLSTSSSSPSQGQPSNLSYMQRPPTILPNYGKQGKHGLTLKTNLPRVLLYDNVTQQSILDAQLSYIQSQRYKSRRQLEMNIKSFLLRRQRKEKALNKLTQVQHGDDYAQFELEYNGSIARSVKKMSGHCNSSFSLPNIQSEKRGETTVNNSPLENGGVNQEDSLPALSYNHVSRKERPMKSSCLFSDSQQHEETGHDIHLPGIKPAFLPKQSFNGKQQANSALQLVQHRNRKLRFKHNFCEFTGIIEPGSDNTTVPYIQVSDDPAFKKSTLVNTNNSNNQSGDNELTFQVDTTNTHLEKQSKEINNIIVNINTSNEFIRNKQIKAKQPVFDNRFLQLQKILIRQCPPNEGFTALSPSFKSKRSFNYANEPSLGLHKKEISFSRNIKPESHELGK